MTNLGKFLSAVLSGATTDSSEERREDGSKRVHIRDLKEGKEDEADSVSGSWTRVVKKISDGGTICSPDVALGGIIRNFNDTCKCPNKLDKCREKMS